MKKKLLVLALLFAYSSSHSSTPNDDKKKKIACTVGFFLIPVSFLGGPAALSAVTAAWAQACVGPKGGGATPVPVFKKTW